MPNKQRNDEPMRRLFEGCAIRAAEDGENDRRYHISFSSEAPYQRAWGTEILSHEEGAVDLSRLNSIGVVLFNHDSNNIVGKIISAKIENGRGEADIEFDNDDYMSFVREKVMSGTLKGVSVGYVVDTWEDLKKGQTSADGRFKGPCSIARQWQPYEISIVSLPADPTVGVSRAAEEAQPEDDGVSHFSSYYREKQLQINTNTILLQEVKRS